MSSKLPKIIFGFLALILVLIVGIQIYIALSRPYSIETVYLSKVGETFDVNGIVSREETVLDGQKSGAVNYLIRNGDKVARNSVVAQLYPSEQNISNMAKAERLEAELKAVEGSQKPGAVTGTQAATLNRQIRSITGEYVAALQKHDISDLYTMKNDFLDAFNRSQIAFGNVSDFNTRIEILKSEIAALRQKSGQSVSSITSPVSGYFVNSIDGFESLVSMSRAEILTEQEIENFLTMEKPTVNDAVAGKVITNAKWRYTALVDAADAVLLREGRKYGLLFRSAADETITATVISNGYDAAKEKAVVVFETNIFSEKLVKLRVEEAQVILQTYEGIKIPKSALYIVKDKKGEDQKGVYVKYGQEMQFKLVDILYENDEYFVSADKETELDRSKYVRIYDDVIVKGSDLYDGKQIS